MSAFMQSTTHIDALLTAGLRFARHSPLRWSTRALTDEEKAVSHQAGEPWGPEAHTVAKRVMRELTRETAGQVGAMLLAQNRYSVDFRYAEEEIEEPYLFSELPGHPDPLIVLNAIAGYEYQACETPDWQETEAQSFCHALRAACINALPGYREIESGWSINDRDVFSPKAPPKPEPIPDTAVPSLDDDAGNLDKTIKRIRAALKRRSGKAWSVTRGKGTAYCWIDIHSPPSRRTNDPDGGPCTDPTARYYMTTEDQAELKALLGLEKVHYQGESIAASAAHRREYIDRAEGREPTERGTQYWD